MHTKKKSLPKKLFKPGETQFRKTKTRIRRIQAALIAVLLIFAFLPMTARADTDYSELNEKYGLDAELTYDNLMSAINGGLFDNMPEEDQALFYEEEEFLKNGGTSVISQGNQNQGNVGTQEGLDTEERTWDEGQFPFDALIYQSGVQQAEKATAYYMSEGMTDKVNDVIEDVYLPLVRSGGSLGTSGNVGASMLTMGTISKAIIGVSYLMIFVVIAIMFAKELSTGNVTYETLIRLSMTLIIGLFVAKNINILFGYVDNVGDYIRLQVYTVVTRQSEQTALQDTMLAAIQDNFGVGTEESIAWLGIKGAIENLLVNLQLLVLYVLMVITAWLIILPMYAIIIELLIRRAFAPLAISSFVRDGFHGPGTEFLKNYLSCYVRIAMMYVVTLAGGLMINNVVVSGGSDIKFITLLIQIVFIRLAIKGVAQRTDQLALSVMGGR